ncbi:exodeoxyribonuclease VII large subunit [Nostocoides veronense]|uniref:Exodeoxyribonuclease 7 large subunit n=1 Tax=Nostocoides veronense TaxID=330836 RepID=A0ABP4YEM1_9MICO
MSSTPAALPERAADTSPEHPWPLRLLSLKIGEYIEKMSVVWVEGQVVQLDRRAGTAYLTLRDVDVDMSFNVAISTNALDAMPRPLSSGQRVVVQAKPAFWNKRGSLTLDARQIRPVGIGELLARLEYLKRTLASEGLFAPDRKKPLPFLPRTIGLITGRASAAERDVVENARRRWPGIPFEIRAVPVQGSAAVEEVCRALADLDALADVEVIVIARGGGSVEDLLAFSNESLVRAVAGARTPIVSAIGHDIDTPILDLVADVRASTPTHAASLVVPDAAELRSQLDLTSMRLRRSIGDRLQRERRRLVELTSRPVLTDRTAYIRTQRMEIATMRRRGQLRMESLVARDQDRVEHLRRQARLLSPQATLDRGYALVTAPDGEVITDQDQVAIDDLLRVRVARGDFPVRATAT